MAIPIPLLAATLLSELDKERERNQAFVNQARASQQDLSNQMDAIQATGPQSGPVRVGETTHAEDLVGLDQRAARVDQLLESLTNRMDLFGTLSSQDQAERSAAQLATGEIDPNPILQQAKNQARLDAALAKNDAGLRLDSIPAGAGAVDKLFTEDLGFFKGREEALGPLGPPDTPEQLLFKQQSTAAEIQRARKAGNEEEEIRLLNQLGGSIRPGSRESGVGDTLLRALLGPSGSALLLGPNAEQVGAGFIEQGQRQEQAVRSQLKGRQPSAAELQLAERNSIFQLELQSHAEKNNMLGASNSEILQSMGPTKVLAARRRAIADVKPIVAAGTLEAKKMNTEIGQKMAKSMQDFQKSLNDAAQAEASLEQTQLAVQKLAQDMKLAKEEQFRKEQNTNSLIQQRGAEGVSQAERIKLLEARNDLQQTRLLALPLLLKGLSLIGSDEATERIIKDLIIEFVPGFGVGTEPPEEQSFLEQQGITTPDETIIKLPEKQSTTSSPRQVITPEERERKRREWNAPGR